MARLPIPDFGTEYPEYEYHPFPRYVGADQFGEAIIAKDEKEYEALKGTEYFPRVMGTDKDGKDVVAQSPRDLEWLKSSVVKPPEDPAVIAKREADRLAAEAEIKRKAEAYDALMAKQASGDKVQADAPAAAENALTAPVKAAAASGKSKAA